MKILTSVFVLIASFGHFSHAQTIPIQLPANWSKPHYYNTANSAFQNGAFIVPIQPTQMGIIFVIPATVGSPPVPVRSTSAEIKNATGVVIRKLWQNRAYLPGQHGEVWDGLDDYGVAAIGGPFTPLLQYNAVKYEWDGILGNNNPNIFAPNSWEQISGGFPTDMVSMGGAGFTANGYNEGGYNSATFQLATPMLNVQPLVPQNVNGDIFRRASSDGKLVYFTDYINSVSASQGGIIAFDSKGNLHNFSAGTVLPKIIHFSNSADPKNVRYLVAQVADVFSKGTGFITGIAVQRNGNLLASAHGAAGKIASADKVYLFDKKTGAPVSGAAGSFTVTNPQRMAFDQSGDLWVISGTGVGGGDALFKVTGVGTTNTITKPIGNLSNPMALSVSPLTGNLFVADGGTNQQVIEYNVATNTVVRTLGAKGGYGIGSSCNSTMTHYKFWFDHGGRDISSQVDNFSTDTFINADDQGNLEVNDPTIGQIQFYRLVSGVWTYTQRIMFQPWQRTFNVDQTDPTRIFLGEGAMMELHRNWTEPLIQGDPDPAVGGNGSWREVNNWWPCIQSATGYRASVMPYMRDVWNSPTNGLTYILTGDVVGFAKGTLNSNGSVTIEPVPPTGGWHGRLTPSGQYFTAGGHIVGGVSTGIYNVQTVTSYDSANMPVLSTPTPRGSVITTHAHGEPQSTSGLAADTTTGGFIPIWDGQVNTDVTGKTPAYHLGGWKAGSSNLLWSAMPQKDIAWADGDANFPSVNMAHLAQEGGAVQTLGREILTMYAGNYSAWGCQFFHYHEDGLPIAQFGYMPTFSGSPNGLNSWGVNGIPQPLLGENRAPGFCGDVGDFVAFYVGADIKIIHGDEGVYHGLHEWSISRLDTIKELTGTGPIGSTVILHLAPEAASQYSPRQ